MGGAAGVERGRGVVEVVRSELDCRGSGHDVFVEIAGDDHTRRRFGGGEQCCEFGAPKLGVVRVEMQTHHE